MGWLLKRDKLDSKQGLSIDFAVAQDGNFYVSGEVVKFDQAGMPQLEVWLEDETIWLTQKQMAELFGCAPQNTTYHLREIFKIGELEEASTCKEFLQVQIEGG